MRLRYNVGTRDPLDKALRIIASEPIFWAGF
jgi:hypothetical protein